MRCGHRKSQATFVVHTARPQSASGSSVGSLRNLLRATPRDPPLATQEAFAYV